MALLEFQSVSFSYGEKETLRDITCQFNAGEMVGLIGPNGAGKSTLLKLIMAAIKPDCGDVKLQQKSIARFSKRALAKQVSLVPQDTSIGYAFSVEEIVSMGRNPHLGRFQPPTVQDQAIVEDALKQTNLQSMSKRFINTLSGGERQRVLVARSIAQQTEVVLFDEATANLDICHQLEVMELARKLANDGRLVICAIHDLNMAARFCDRLLLLADNTLQANDIPVKVLTEEKLCKYFAIAVDIQINHDVQSGSLNITPIQSLHHQ